MSKQMNFFRGIPTKIEVDKLTEVYGVPNEGDCISFKDAAAAVGLSPDGNRFRTVFRTWRRMLFRQHNMLSVGTGDGRIRFANPTERIDYATRKVKQGRKAIGLAIFVAHGTDAKRLNADNAKVREQLLALNESKMRLASTVMK